MSNKSREEIKSKKIKAIREDLTDDLINKNWVGIGIIILFLSISFFKLGFLGYEPIAQETNTW